MKKKIKKLIKKPNLFFRDMIENKKKRIDMIKIFKSSIEFDCEIIIVADGGTENIINCITSIKKQNTILKNEAKIKILDIGLSIECREILQKKWFYDCEIIESMEMDFKYFISTLKNENILFIWGDDYIENNFISETSKFMSSSNNKFSIILPYFLKENNNGKLQEYHPLQSLFAKYNHNTNTSNLIILDSIYGSILSTKDFIKSTEKYTDFSWISLNGLSILLSIACLTKNKKIGLSNKSKYISHERNILQPFKEANWTNKDIFCCSFSNLVSCSYNLIKQNNIMSVIVRRSLFNLTLKYIKRGLSNQSLLDMCTDDERSEFKANFQHALKIIGNGIIANFNHACGELIKSGCVKINNGYRFNNTIDFVQYNESKDSVLLRYYTSELLFERFYLNGNDTLPSIDKTVEHKLFSDVFVYERRIWFPLKSSNTNSDLTVYIDENKVKFRGLDRKVYIKTTNSQIIKQHNSLKIKFNVNYLYKDCWILMDRDNQADDNAEHLYRYIQAKRPDINAYFVISESSHDWLRLKEDGFRLLSFGSPEHEQALESCSKVISSHAAQFATDYFKDKRMLWKKFVFLQHGVIHNDQSALFKPDWKKFDLFITSAYREYESISGNKSGYKFTTEEVKLTGLPRHDELINSAIVKEKIILVMPTWRPALLGKVISGTERELLPDFIESTYAKSWINFLSHSGLRESARVSGYKIVFFPHANIQPYLSDINLPDDIEVMSHATGSIQDLFLKASIMVTDYSSVAFEMAYLRKPVCYYQFDEDDFFTKGHYNKGYFDYRKDGFGPVLTNEEDVVEYVLKSIKNNCTLIEPYTTQAESFFPYRDGKCCERVIDAIELLDTSDEDTTSNINKLEIAANNAYLQGYWHQALPRYERILNNKDIDFSTLQNGYYLWANYIKTLQNLGYVMKSEIILADNPKLQKSVSKKINLRGNIINDLLTEQNPSLTTDDFPSLYKDDHLIYTIFTSKDIINCSSIISRLKNEFITKLDDDLSEEPLSIISLIDKNKSKFNLFLLRDDFIHLYFLQFSGKSDAVIKYYDTLSYGAREYILNKKIYLSALKKMRKWGRILQIIGNDPILQGRTGIVHFASIYFFAAIYGKVSIERSADFNYIFNKVNEIDFNLLSDIAKYYLIIKKDSAMAGVIIENHIRDFDSKMVDLYIRLLCQEKNHKHAYLVLQTCDLLTLTQNNLILLGDLAIIFEEYTSAERCFQQACLNKLPAIDKDLQKRLTSARFWKDIRQTEMLSDI
ncbi:CDP-Glycerol:Poly(glycerophosphate) glycerophosphotransferase [Yersinia intermedia]|uniref:CDP-glycerol glycerophosphotransferase family protein n=1 Tax=Yersinia intermedia TaxID=631 RepID=UPI0005DEC63B|nr:CDP-glycerol glycerophosphotransferase family protein [Yersinia intermedia]CNJ66967.1 CDP-Glycerol:Poly(glycerophosphate) glycerophosphotransferase [Yersinia intermedia]